ncbi:hypothetical protein SAMN06265360_11931 [Haloechinothrix alba]|uniref:DUF5709 domain-containing protein n=1 Tax=Haloechinothrix alba TaxID=664784 RepID=A0A238Z4K3_9PSEU|nr:hypothetical protein [Haloechinothrix alba]SNR78250.1 hypothetical protein SAMN06265360_11931 [Haloechinothrix alba]
MADYEDPVTPPQDTGAPDEVESDPVALSSSEDLDEDQLRLDPLEKGAEPPEGWSAADRFGTTPFEHRQGEDLDERVRQEQPDPEVPDEAVPPEPLERTDSELSEAVDDVHQDTEQIDPGQPIPAIPTHGERHDQHADEAGGSLAESLREPGRESR